MQSNVVILPLDDLVAEENAVAFERELGGFPCAHVGAVTSRGKLRVKGVNGSEILDVPVDDLRRAFQGGFQG